jgi:hypothetical protein
MEKAGQLQCNALRGLQKSRRRRNNGKQCKNNAQNNGNSRKSGREATSGCIAKATELGASRRQVDGACSQDLSMSLGEIREKLPEKYRRFTGRRCAPNAAKAIEIAEEKARNLNRRKTGPENRKNRAMNRWIAPVSGGRIPGLLFLPHRDNRPPRTDEILCGDLARLKPKRARSGGAPDARTSLCTYCHAPLAPGTQAEFDLSPLFTRTIAFARLPLSPKGRGWRAKRAG